MKIRLLLFLIVITLNTVSAQETDSLLVVLEKTMANRAGYDAGKQQHIAKLEQQADEKNITNAVRYTLNNQLIKEYLPYKFDTALDYITRNIALAKKMDEPLLLNEARLYMARILSSSGNYKEAVDILAEIKKEQLTPQLISQYYYEYMWVNFRLSFYTPVQQSHDAYTALYNAYADSLVARSNPHSEDYLAVQENRYRQEGDYDKSLAANLKRLAMAQPRTRTYGSVTFFIARCYALKGNIALQKKYLILSAISDIQASVKDNASLTELAILLFKENDIERAHRYINFAFEDAAFYNSKLRFISISNILPLINKAYETDIKRQKDKLQNSLIIISVLSLLLLFTLAYLYRQLKNLSAARKNLQEANAKLVALNEQLTAANAELKNLNLEITDISRVKEHYIGNLLNLCSDYIDKLDVYRNTVKKMILTKQVAALLNKTKSNEIITAELDQFYKNFDGLFLHIYPDFVSEFNSLLKLGEEIVPKKGELLTTELRIFALIRLGISESSSIAKLLRYSVNTIYNYRVKIKNKAAGPREDFETHVMKIGTSS